MHVYMCAWVDVWMCGCVDVWMCAVCSVQCACLHVCTFACVHLCTCARVHVCMCAYWCACVHSQVVILLTTLGAKRTEFNAGKRARDLLEIKRVHYKTVDFNRDARQACLQASS